MSEALKLAEKISEETFGTQEWRVQHPVEKKYCMSMTSRDHINPEREIREWFDDYKTRFPNGNFSGYEVAAVTMYSNAEKLCIDAAALLRTQAAELEALRAERDALRADAERYRWLKTQTWYVGPEPTCEYAAFVDYENNNCGELDAAIDAAKEQIK